MTRTQRLATVLSVIALMALGLSPLALAHPHDNEADAEHVEPNNYPDVSNDCGTTGTYPCRFHDAIEWGAETGLFDSPGGNGTAQFNPTDPIPRNSMALWFENYHKDIALPAIEDAAGPAGPEGPEGPAGPPGEDGSDAEAGCAAGQTEANLEVFATDQEDVDYTTDGSQASEDDASQVVVVCVPDAPVASETAAE